MIKILEIKYSFLIEYVQEKKMYMYFLIYKNLFIIVNIKIQEFDR